MQIDWTTFLLEILNFLVLVWILKRFLYKPVLDALDARAVRICKESEDADAAQQEAETLKQKYKKRQDEWNTEREEKRRELDGELIEERKARMEELQRTLADERARLASREASLSASREQLLSQSAVKSAYANTATMLTRLADATLTVHLTDMLIDDLAALPEEKQEKLRRAAEEMEKGESMEIITAHTLDDGIRRSITKAMEKVTGCKQIPCHVAVFPELIAGVRIAIGEVVLHANLADELAFFLREEENA